MRLRYLAAFGILTALSLVGCGGSSKVDDLAIQEQPRPPYSSLNLVVSNADGTQVTKQLFLDPGTSQFPKSWPIKVANHRDNQGVDLWRWDFFEPNKTDGTQWYATVMARVDNAPGGIVSFYGNGGNYQTNAYTLNPNTAFSGNIPETPNNKRATAMFLFIRQGAPCLIAEPQTIGKAAPYRGMGGIADVSVNIPGLDFAVGGVTLSTDASTGATAVTSDVGNSGAISDLQIQTQGSTPSDPITTPITTIDTERIATLTRVDPVTSEWDLAFAWTPPALGVTLTHSFMVDPTLATGSWQTGEFGAVGGGFFLTMNPGAPSPTEGRNTLNWSILRTQSDPVWCIGWAADVSATGSIQAGQGGDALSTKAPGSALVSGQVRGYLSGVMRPSAQITMFSGLQDQQRVGGAAVLFEGTSVPLIARNKRALITGTLPQTLVGGRTIWSRQNGLVLGADVKTSDQTLVQRYGTTLGFSAYLPVLSN